MYHIDCTLLIINYQLNCLLSITWWLSFLNALIIKASLGFVCFWRIFSSSTGTWGSDGRPRGPQRTLGTSCYGEERSGGSALWPPPCADRWSGGRSSDWPPSAPA